MVGQGSKNSRLQDYPGEGVKKYEFGRKAGPFYFKRDRHFGGFLLKLKIRNKTLSPYALLALGIY